MMDLQVYRDPRTSKELVEKLIPLLQEKQQQVGRKLRFMEVCGTHTVAISKSGIRDILSPYVDLTSGPGCPVCVTDQSDIDQMIGFAKNGDVIITTFGDMMKVPGSSSTLYEQRAQGADVRIVYSPSESIEIAKENPNKMVVFLGVGFETTTPSIAMSIQRAKAEGVRNYAVYSAHKITTVAVDVLMQDETANLDGFILPGNVSVIIGRQGWSFLEDYNFPSVIGGFEPLDILSSIYQLALEMDKEKRLVVNNYARVVKEEGNRKAQQLVSEVFTPDSMKWRGLGTIAGSGLEVSTSYEMFDAKKRVAQVEPVVTREIKGCQCGEILKGKRTPFECKLFARACTPERPIGPCMVSSEGSCSTYYKYERGKEIAAK